MMGAELDGGTRHQKGRGVMYIHISFVDQGLADQQRNSLQATGQNMESSMAALRLLMALLLTLGINYAFL